jgi:hypothetical protein
MKVKEFELVNEEKVDRVINGSMTANGMVGGIKQADGSVDEELLIAEYDKLGGLILKGNDRVKTGSFYDFKSKRALKEPKVVFIYNINGKVVEVEDGVELPGVVKAAKVLAGQEVEKKKKAKKVIEE